MEQAILVREGHSKQTLEAVARYIGAHLSANKKDTSDDSQPTFLFEREWNERFNVHKSPLRNKFNVRWEELSKAGFTYGDKHIAEVSLEKGKVKVVVHAFHDSISSLLEHGLESPKIDRSQFEIVLRS